MHECPKTHFKHKCMHASHHATSSCHVTMPHHHAMSSCHITMPSHHTTSSFHLACHVIMPHHHAMSACHIIMTHYHAMSLECTFWLPRGSLRECHVALQPKFSLLGQTSKRNIFCIRSSFDTPFAPLESDWWAIRHGTIFVTIWWF